MEKIGWQPVVVPKIAYAIDDEIRLGIIALYSKSLRSIISAAMIAPPRGA